MSRLPQLGHLARQAQPLTPEEESITNALLRNSIGAVSGAAHLIGTPGAMVNRALMGENPLMPLLSPISGEYHKYGRDVLRHYGLAGRRDTWGNFAGGLALDVATDPLTWMMPAKAALTPAGTLAKKAGLMKYVGRPLQSQASKTMGRATARQTQTIADLLATSVPKRQRADAIRRLFSTGELSGMTRQEVKKLARSKVLGGWGGIGMPIIGKEPWAVFGASGRPGTIAAKWAGLKDAASYGLRTSRAGRGLTTLFSGSARGATQAPTQEHGFWLNAAQDAAEVNARKRTMDLMRRATDAGLVDAGGAAMKPHQRDAYVKIVEAMTKGDADRTINGIVATVPELAGKKAELQKFARFHRNTMQQDLRAAKAAGATVDQLRDLQSGYAARFIPREWLRPGWRQEGAELAGQMHLRSDPLRDIPGGRLTIEKLVRDTAGVADNQLETTLRGMFGTYGIKGTYYTTRQAKQLKQIESTVQAAVAKRAATIQTKLNALLAKQQSGATLTKSEVSDLARWSKPFDQAKEFTRKFKEASKHIKPHDRAKGIAKTIKGLTPEARTGGMFGNDPIVDEMLRIGMHEHGKANALFIQDILGDTATHVAKDQPHMLLGTIAKKLNLSPKTVSANLGIAADTPIHRGVAKDLIKAAERLKAPQSTEGLLKLMDNANALFKGSQTSPWLAFHARNRFGGVFQGTMDQALSWRAWIATKRMLAGESDSFWRTHPIIKQEAKRRGLDAAKMADQDVLSIAQELSYRYSAAPMDAGEHMARVGTGTPSAARTMQGTLGQMPGKLKPMRYRDAFGRLKDPDTTLNPLKAEYRGVGEGQRSTLAPMAVGEQLGTSVETMNRLPAFWELTRKGMSPEEAVRSVNLSQVSYARNEYSPFVNEVLLRAVPFGKFQIGMLKKMAHELTTRPGGRHAQAIRFADRLQQQSSGGEPVPDWVGQQMAIKVGESPDKDPRYLTGFGLMHEPALEYLQPSLKGLALHGLGQTAPIFKYPMELATGQTFFQTGPLGGRQIEDLDPTWGRIGRMVQQRAQAGKPIGKFEAGWAPAMQTSWSKPLEHLAANLPFSRVGSTLRTAIDPRRGLLERAMNIGTGFRTTIVSPAARDAHINDVLIAAVKRHPAGKIFITPYFSKQAKEQMTPEELAEVERLEMLRNLLTRRAKARAKERQK